MIGEAACAPATRIVKIVKNRVSGFRIWDLPWIHVKNLASRVLALASRRLAEDWHTRYAYRPVLLETFGEKPRPAPAGQLEVSRRYAGPRQARYLHCHDKSIKSIWVYPLEKHFHQTLGRLKCAKRSDIGTPCATLHEDVCNRQIETGSLPITALRNNGLC